MMNGDYECLDDVESNNRIEHNPERRCLRIRLSRVFSSGSLKSPKSPGYSSLSDSTNSPEVSPMVKTRYSWQNHNLQNTLPQIPTFMENIKTSENTCENKMKYSPQQQQKERKSESDVASMIATPSRTSRSRDSAHGCSSNRIINSSMSTGIFAWMRVFRMATLLHQIGC